MRLIDELIMKKEQEEGKRITQTAAANAIGVSPVVLHQVLTGKNKGTRGYSEEVKKKAAEYFGLTVGELEEKIRGEIEAGRE